MFRKKEPKLIAEISRLPDDIATTMTYGKYRDSDLVLWHRRSVIASGRSLRLYLSLENCQFK